MTADAASLAVAGIIFVPPVVWTPVGAGAETKFQCSGIVNTAYDEVCFFVCLLVCLLVCLFVRGFICLFVRIFVRLLISFSLFFLCFFLSLFCNLNH